MTFRDTSGGTALAVTRLLFKVIQASASKGATSQRPVPVYVVSLWYLCAPHISTQAVVLTSNPVPDTPLLTESVMPDSLAGTTCGSEDNHTQMTDLVLIHVIISLEKCCSSQMRSVK